MSTSENIKIFASIVDIWEWIVGCITVLYAGYRAWRKFGSSIGMALRLSSDLHKHYGKEAAKKIIESLSRAYRNGAIREARQQFIESELGLPIFVCSKDGRCEYTNKELNELLGLDSGACSGFGWIEGVDPIQRQRVYEKWMYITEHSLPYYEEYTVVNQRTGEKTECVARARPAKDQDGEILCYVGTVMRLNK